MRAGAAAMVVWAAAWLAGCASQPDRAPALAEGYVGPAKLQLREELVARAEVVAQLEHGERVEIIGRRRRFLKVRTAEGAEGWMDGAQILSEKEMGELRALAERAAREPSQGTANSFDALNVHTAPNRQAPSFFQLSPEDEVAVVTHQRAARAPFVAPAFLRDLQRPAAPVKRAKKKKKEPEVPPPPAGAPPGVPEKWLEMSGRREAAVAPAPAPEPVKPEAPLEWWTLVRARDGRAGWVLTSLLYLAIPEEVAQYAERARITSYYPLGQVAARSGELKNVWLWTTLAVRGVDHHFDSLRVFTWSTRRQRYETAYIERNIKGWLPVRLAGEGVAISGWEALIENREGKLQKVSYLWDGSRVRVTGREAAELPAAWYQEPGQGGEEGVAIPEEGATPAGRLAEMLKALRERFSR